MGEDAARQDPGAVNVAAALRIALAFDPAGDASAAKSQALTIDLLRHTGAPFSRDQFTPGHVTCTALVRHPELPLVLFMHHHRLSRWLLPGGHVEASDMSLDAAAAREAREETSISLDEGFAGTLAGMDVHGIPPKRGEPYHLHHDLIWCFQAATEEIAVSEEAPAVMWAGPEEWDRMEIASSIRLAIRRVGLA